jgi:glyoxylase-like metal-dependent hydrolase (beta-lactamase superfamily II)
MLAFTMHTHVTRRDLFGQFLGGIIAGASVLEAGFLRAAWARAQRPRGDARLFDIQKVAEGVYFGQAHPQVLTNCNAAIFVNSKEVVVVDAHSKPSAAVSLVAQIRKEVTSKPVAYLINTHFHWDHTQGDAAYRAANSKVQIIASEATKQLLAENAQNRLKDSLEGVPQIIDALKIRLAKASRAGEKESYQEQIRQAQAYLDEMKSFTPELPDITFTKSYQIKDRTFDLQIGFHGRAHTAGDVAVFCPQRRAVASGDAIIGWVPNIADGYPRDWPRTIDSIGELSPEWILPGHGPLQPDRQRMVQMRNYIEELTGLVENGKKAGQPLAELKATIMPSSVKSLSANGYGAYMAENLNRFSVYVGSRTAFEDRFTGNIEAIYNNLDRA